MAGWTRCDCCEQLDGSSRIDVFPAAAFPRMVWLVCRDCREVLAAHEIDANIVTNQARLGGLPYYDPSGRTARQERAAFLAAQFRVRCLAEVRGHAYTTRRVI